eukprot:COSAG05_NODE_15677_length_364_cov_0.690566_2_plen_29_part_01
MLHTLHPPKPPHCHDTTRLGVVVPTIRKC